MTFGVRIRQLRKAHNLTLRELAEQVGINFTYLSKVENDRADPPAEATIRRLANALGVDADELILLAGKLPDAFKRDLLSRPECQMAELYRSLAGKQFSEEEWEEIVAMIRRKGWSV